jgi:hypothetical protein
MTENTVANPIPETVKAQKIAPKMTETEFAAIAAQFARTDSRMWGLLGKATDAELRDTLENAIAVRALLTVVASDARAVSFTPSAKWGFDGANCASILRTILGSATKSIYGKLLRKAQ